MFIGNLSGNILIYHDCVTYPYKALKAGDDSHLHVVPAGNL